MVLCQLRGYVVYHNIHVHVHAQRTNELMYILLVLYMSTNHWCSLITGINCVCSYTTETLNNGHIGSSTLYVQYENYKFLRKFLPLRYIAAKGNDTSEASQSVHLMGCVCCLECPCPLYFIIFSYNYTSNLHALYAQCWCISRGIANLMLSFS